MKTMQPIDDGRIERGHVTECAGCGQRGVFVDTDAGEVVDSDGRPVSVEMDDGLVPLLAGRCDGSRTDEVFCEDCAEID